jgi:hypothetical protein
MKTTNYSFFITLCFLVMMSSCTMCSTKTEEETAADEISNAMNELQEELKKAGNDVEGDVADAMGKVSEAMEQLKQDGKVVEPVNFRVLKGGIPLTFLGMERTKAEGETTGAMGFKISTAKATYQDGDKRVDIEIIDVGGIGMAAMGMAAWAMAEIDKESDNGFERTTTFEGHKAFEKCNGDRCEFSAWMGKRIIFNVKSYNVGMDDIKKGMKKDIDLDDLMDKVADES